VIDCLNSSVFSCKRSELHLLDIEGVYCLLDLIETCEPALKRVTLSALCTILENNKSLQYFVEWNSASTTINASQLLIQLFQSEDQRYGVKYVNGILNDLQRPLLPRDNYYERKQIEGDPEGRRAGEELKATLAAVNDSKISQGGIAEPDRVSHVGSRASQRSGSQKS